MLSLMWLLIAGLGIFVLARTVIWNRKKTAGASTPYRASAASFETDLLQCSSELLTLGGAIKALGLAASPGLAGVQDVAQALSAAYPFAITTLQQRQVESTLPQTLEGKRITWELRTRDVSDHPSSFFFDYRGLGGYWIECSDSSQAIYVACQTLGEVVRGLRPDQPFTARGFISKVGIQWPLIYLLISDAAISPAQNGDSAGWPSPPETGDLEGLCHTPISVPQAPIFRSDDRLGADVIDGPSYQTAPLSEYSEALYARALELFNVTAQQVGAKAKEYKGSFTITARSCGETAAKIIIYERGYGRENGQWPDLRNGIYILIRSNGVAGRAIWDGGLVASSTYFGRLDQKRTLGIAPKHSERFAYFRLEPDDDIRAVAEVLTMSAAA